MKSKFSAVVLLLVIFLSQINGEQEDKRSGKFIFVSTYTSTSFSTTTVVESTSFSCLLLSKTSYTACGGRRKKRSLMIDNLNNVDKAEDIQISKVQKSGETPKIEASIKQKPKSDREGRFAWYYMTTTSTSAMYITETSTTFTSTISLSAMNCTPTNFQYCYGR
jgi:hypothetical protein